MNVQSMPPCARTGYAVIETRLLKSLAAGSDGKSTHFPSMSYFQP